MPKSPWLVPAALKPKSRLAEWRGTYLINDLTGRTVKQAAKTLKFWGVTLPLAPGAAGRELRTVGLTVTAGRVARAGGR